MSESVRSVAKRLKQTKPIPTTPEHFLLHLPGGILGAGL